MGRPIANQSQTVVVMDEDIELKAFKSEDATNKYADNIDATVEERYFESNASIRKNAIPAYSQTTIFPRMYFSQDQKKVNGYKLVWIRR